MHFMVQEVQDYLNLKEKDQEKVLGFEVRYFLIKQLKGVKTILKMIRKVMMGLLVVGLIFGMNFGFADHIILSV